MFSMTAVIPVFNSEDSLEPLYERLSHSLAGLTENYTIILVDDGSSDRSYPIMCELHERDPRVKVIRLKHNYGQQNAIICGLHYADSDYTVILDDDLQNPPEEISKLLVKLLEGYDIVYGVPHYIPLKKPRLLGTVLRDFLFKILFDMPKGVKVSSFRMMRKKIVERIKQDKTSFVYISAMIFRDYVHAASVTVDYHQREYGRSNYRLLKLMRIYLRIILNYSTFFSKFADRSHPQYEIAEKKM